jgi:hypothetical protein
VHLANIHFNAVHISIKEEQIQEVNFVIKAGMYAGFVRVKCFF